MAAAGMSEGGSRLLALGGPSRSEWLMHDAAMATGDAHAEWSRGSHGSLEHSAGEPQKRAGDVRGAEAWPKGTGAKRRSSAARMMAIMQLLALAAALALALPPLAAAALDPTNSGEDAIIYAQPEDAVDVPSHVFANPNPWPRASLTGHTASVFWQHGDVGGAALHTPTTGGSLEAWTGTAAAASARVLKKRAAHNHLSSRTVSLVTARGMSGMVLADVFHHPISH